MMVEYVSLIARDNIMPRLELRVGVTATSKGEQYLAFAGGNFYVRNEFIGRVFSLSGIFHYLELNKLETLSFCIYLTPLQIETIEKLRGRDDLWIRITLSFHRGATPEELFTRPPYWEPGLHKEYGEQIKIAKSDWVEEYLPKLGYKRIRLIEVPLIAPVPEEFKAIVDGIEEAWRYFAMGEYRQTLSSCRIVIEALRNWFYSQGMKRVKQVNQKQKMLPDFRKFTNSERLGRAMERMYEGLYELVSLGPHFFPHGISRPEAECALMNTYSLVNYVIKIYCERFYESLRNCL